MAAYLAITHWLIDPAAWVLALLVAALLFGRYGHPVWRDRLIATAAIFLLALFVLPFDEWLARPIENEYPRANLPAHVDGILVLNGSMLGVIFKDRHIQGTGRTVLRIMAGADLARRHPEAKLIFSGTSGGARQIQDAEFAAVLDAFAEMGIAPTRVILERTSRDTGENFANSLRLARPKPGENWVLVTSAIHMARSMAIARKVGWTMLPWPSDYMASAHAVLIRLTSPSQRMHNIADCMHEWIGMVVYRLTGRAKG